MKNKIAIKLIVFGIIFILCGGTLIIYSNWKKQPSDNKPQEEKKLILEGDKFTDDELKYYEDTLEKLSSNLQAYQFQYVYPVDENADSFPVEMKEQILDEAKKTKLISFIKETMPTQKVPKEVGWSPYTKAINIFSGETNLMTIYPYENSFCFFIYNGDQAIGFIFDEKQDVYNIIK